MQSRKINNNKPRSKRTGSWVRLRGGPVFACIDMGTNSFHMVVCQATPERDHFEVIVKVKEAVPFLDELSPHTTSTTSR